MSNSNIGWRKAGIAGLASTLVLGASLAGAGSALAAAGFSFDRIAGADRYATSALAADEYDSSADSVILANGEPGHYPDALSANFLAGWWGNSDPILLTHTDVTPSVVLNQLNDYYVASNADPLLRELDITIVGGTGVVTTAQADALRDLGYTVTRVAGADRFATNAAVINEVGSSYSIGFIATGMDFPDALGAGSPVFQGHALGLSRSNDIDDAVVDALVDAGVSSVVVLGGPTIVGPAVISELADAGITLEERVFGADRSATSTNLADYLLGQGFGGNGFYFEDDSANVASGYTLGTGADALAGGPVSGDFYKPMLITRDVNNPGDLLRWLEVHASTLTEDGFIFGGTGAVSAAAQAAMETAGGPDTTSPASTYMKQTNGAGLANTLDSGDTIKVVFNEQMDAPDDGDKIRFTDADGTVVDVTCGAGTAACSLNALVESVNGVDRPANTVLTLLLAADPTPISAGTTAGLQVASGSATDQAGNTDLSGNGWDLGAASTDKSLA